MWPLDQLVDLFDRQRLTERDKDCIRQLVALEVTFNFYRLLDICRQLISVRASLGMAVLYLDNIIGKAPTWERVRWDSAPVLLARSLSKDDLLRIGNWYMELDSASQFFQRIARQGALIREWDGDKPFPHLAIPPILNQFEEMLLKIAQLVDKGRPYVHPAVEKALKAKGAKESSTAEVQKIDPAPPRLVTVIDGREVRVTAATILDIHAELDRVVPFDVHVLEEEDP